MEVMSHSEALFRINGAPWVQDTKSCIFHLMGLIMPILKRYVLLQKMTLSLSMAFFHFILVFCLYSFQDIITLTGFLLQ